LLNMTVNPFCGDQPFGTGRINVTAPDDAYFFVIRQSDGGTCPSNYTDDRFISFCWSNRNPHTLFYNYSLGYCDNYTGISDNTTISPANFSCGGQWQLLAQENVANFSVDISHNWTLVNINLTLRHHPSQPASPDNPEVNLTTKVHIPGIPAQ
ncbi:MAG: hypothetical protein NC829_02110, partial [Candidatus Omnitrophica bacterium]|nr:hypothetical protein [Candidatus Omnitrophota bacterium]